MIKLFISFSPQIKEESVVRLYDVGRLKADEEDFEDMDDDDDNPDGDEDDGDELGLEDDEDDEDDIFNFESGDDTDEEEFPGKFLIIKKRHSNLISLVFFF